MGADRDPATLRPWSIECGASPHAEGSALVTAGRTRVLCTASVLPTAPGWLTGTGRGWITASYDMLPRATHDRRPRDRERVRADGRSLEISRLVGRALRSTVETDYLGERTVQIDCDVLAADGGTRTASVTGGAVALLEALAWMRRKGLIPGVPLRAFVAAVSVGLVAGRPVLDLDYALDKDAAVDLNVVATEDGKLVDVQGTAERESFSPDELSTLIALALGGTAELVRLQRKALGKKLLAEIEA